MNFLTSLALIALPSLVSAAGICSTEISCLSSNTAAQSYCTVMFQAYSYLNPQGTSTVYKTVTADAGGSQVTVTSTAVASVYITEGPTSTIRTTSLVSTTAEATITTYVSGAANAKRAESSCDTSSGLSYLSDLNSNALSTACSCIGAAPTYSTMSTIAIVSLTLTQEAAATVTSVISGEVQFTVAPSLIIPTTITTSFTETSTVTLAAPSFTQVWGPKAGCVDMNSIASESLDPEVGKAEAIATCQGHCAQNPRCSFVFVQLSFENYGEGIDPFFRCEYNNHTLNEADDIECGKTVRIWGAAGGFNAIGRGE